MLKYLFIMMTTKYNIYKIFSCKLNTNNQPTWDKTWQTLFLINKVEAHFKGWIFTKFNLQSSSRFFIQGCLFIQVLGKSCQTQHSHIKWWNFQLLHLKDWYDSCKYASKTFYYNFNMKNLKINNVKNTIYRLYYKK